MKGLLLATMTYLHNYSFMHDKLRVSVTTFMHTVMYTMLDLLFVWFYTLVILLKNASSYGPSVA